MARLVWLKDKLTQAANDETVPKVDIAKLDQLKQVALQNIGELEGLNDNQTIPPVANDEPPKHSQHQVYWYQNDHLGTPRELTSHSGNIEWEAVYQAWGNTVTVEWQEVAQEINPIQLNTVEQSYLLQPHRFQGQIYDVETGLHYNRFRYYDPDAGRFISHDPIGLMGGDNQFQYAPNPVEWVDPLGLRAVWNTRLMRGMLRNKSPLTIGDRVVYQDSKAFKFSNSNICKMLKGQSPRANNGDRIELHHITGKDPGALMEIGSGVHDKISKQLHFFIKESFRRDKEQSRAYDKFREEYWEKRARDHLGMPCGKPSYCS